MSITKIKTPDRPESVALLSGIEKLIYDIATEKMTPIEVLGVLDLAAKNFYEEGVK